MIDPETLGTIRDISVKVAGAATFASAIHFLRDLYKKAARHDETSTPSAKVDRGVEVFVKTLDGESKRVLVSTEEATQLLGRLS